MNNEYEFSIVYDGIITIKANSEEEAFKKLRCMTVDEMYEYSDGTWDYNLNY